MIHSKREARMKLLGVLSLTLMAGASICDAQAMSMTDRQAGHATGLLHLVGNTSSNSSSNTSSNSSAGRSSYVHTHSWSIDSDDGRRRRSTRETIRIKRYGPGDERYYRQGRSRRDGRDDD
jgi:hypothetical protein